MYDLSTGQLVGGAVGIFCFGVVIVVVIVLCARRCGHCVKSAPPSTPPESYGAIATVGSSSTLGDGSYAPREGAAWATTVSSQSEAGEAAVASVGGDAVPPFTTPPRPMLKAGSEMMFVGGVHVLLTP